jgi:hypothetical protein
MFKRGGPTKGTGIMSHVEPRVRAANGFGFPNFGVNSMTEDQVANFREIERKRIESIRNQPSFFLGPRFTDPNFQSPFKNFFSNKTGFEFLNPANKGVPAVFANIQSKTPVPPVGTEGKTGVEIGMEGLNGLTDYEYDALEKKDQQQEAKRLEKDLTVNNPPDITLDTRKSLEQRVTDEAEFLKRILKDEDHSRGELALIISRAIKEPGSLADKIAKASELSLPVVRKRKEEDKAITLAAYKLAKEKEIAGAKQTQQEKLIDEYVSANIKDPANTKSANELRREAVNRYFGGKEDTQKEYNVAILSKYEAVDSSGRSPLQRALEDKKELEGKQGTGVALNKTQQEKLDRANKIIEEVIRIRKEIDFPTLNLAKGGRVKYAEGTDIDEMESEKTKEKVNSAVQPIEATNVAEADQSVPMKPVQKLSYEELRTRLPKEITDDIVQLISNSEEALQDFAYIKDQEDVNGFNVKYGVNLILPPETV